MNENIKEFAEYFKSLRERTDIEFPLDRLEELYGYAEPLFTPDMTFDNKAAIIRILSKISPTALKRAYPIIESIFSVGEYQRVGVLSLAIADNTTRDGAEDYIKNHLYQNADDARIQINMLQGLFLKKVIEDGKDD